MLAKKNIEEWERIKMYREDISNYTDTVDQFLLHIGDSFLLHSLTPQLLAV